MPHASYDLDSLGWYQFERLCQALLKAELGVGVEAWGGRGDFGRDAFFRGNLEFPERGVSSAGPFVFQAKHVEGANAAGAKPGPLISRAVDAELESFQLRAAARGSSQIKHYVLLTNAPISGKKRGELSARIKKVLPQAETTILDGTDLAAMLDNNPKLRRAYPELLSLRDLRALLRETVSASILARSEAALGDAIDVSRAFVSTKAYFRTQEVLAKHHFAVLDGPAEMGKTCTAQMVALGFLADQWETLDCRGPEDFFAILARDRKQVFIADDAFGRTEFDISLGRQWERDLPKVLRSLDRHHLLLLTSRKHILVRARRRMDLQYPADKFPRPAEVLVDAADLMPEEKARMLYRHSKASLSDNERRWLRALAPEIVENPHFTPERIRRLVVDVLPGMAAETTDRECAKQVIVEQISNPTARMRKSFRALPPLHQSVLFAMLDVKDRADLGDLVERADEIQPGASTDEITEAAEELVGSFLRSSTPRFHRLPFDWIHPSYRDLVISELARNSAACGRFLRNASLRGLLLAVSVEGGATGELMLPLMRSDASWTALAARSASVLVERRPGFGFLDALCDAYEHSADPVARGKLKEILTAIAPGYFRGLVDPVYPEAVEVWLRVCRTAPEVPPPELDSLWNYWLLEMREATAEDYVVDHEPVCHWLRLFATLQRFDVAHVRGDGALETLASLLEILDADATVPSDLEPDAALLESETLSDLGEAVSSLEVLPDVALERSARRSASVLQDRAADFYSFAEDHESQDDDWEGPADWEKPSPSLDLVEFFGDL